MKVTIIGAGYVGLVTGACLAELGFRVTCLDIDQQKIQGLKAGILPIYEPGLQQLIDRNAADQRISFTADVQQAVDHGDILFIAVGTPPLEDGSADLAHVLSVAAMIGRYIKGYKLVVNKSTVPVGTADQVRQTIATELKHRGMRSELFDVVSNPEFLKEGAAIEDFMHPDRIVVGIDEGPGHSKSQRMMSDLYASFNRHHERTVWMDVRSAELTKYAANAMLATRISFMNEIANLADCLGADVDKVRRGIGADTRIGHSFLYAGCGYGGSCFPKDTRALVSTALANQSPMLIVDATEQVNKRQKNILVDRLLNLFGHDLQNKNIAIWGLSFKPNTDDMREAPSRVIVQRILAMGARVKVYDPVAMTEAKKAFEQDMADTPEWLERLEMVDTDLQACENADALLVVTEWKNFHNPDFTALRHAMRTPLILDGRNLYNPETLLELGIAYQGIGRRNALLKTRPPAAAPAETAPFEKHTPEDDLVALDS
jgi:UDPglucose 6-dehydrogenase